MGVKKFSLDLEDLYTDTDRVTRVTVYHEDDMILEITDERGKTWEPTELSLRDERKLYSSVLEEVMANRIELAERRMEY